MTAAPLSVLAPARRVPAPGGGAGARAGPHRLAQALLDHDLVPPAALMRAMALESRGGARLGAILLAHGAIDEDRLVAGSAVEWGAGRADLEAHPPDPRLVDRLGAGRCIALGVLPWRRAGGAVVVATSRPAAFAGLRPELEAALGPVAMALATDAALQAALQAVRGTRLCHRAETRTPPEQSCRAGVLPRLRAWVLGALGLVLVGAVLAPLATLAAVTGWAVLMLVLATGLKAAALVAALRGRAEARGTGFGPGPPVAIRMPVVSILVPLHAEGAIVARLLRRLDRLAWPRELLDVIVIVEADDPGTRAALAATGLPPWMRVVAVPAGSLRTKPRAMNYALDFCRGSIIGIYDAEDAPEPDQIHRVVRAFHARGSEVACLQGMLDYYNARQNWLARCFAVEYAAWFRVLLPGLARLGLVVPLGGTTVFFRRAALEAVGGWDAHNVTEDADLGVRLARAGYRTELIETVTGEEATCRPLPWIRQRSRWIKGYAITYASHMRAPGRLWRDLGPWRFFGFQVLFLSTLTQALLAPVLWSFWLLLAGLGHPLTGPLGAAGLVALVVLFLLAEALNIGIGLVAVSQRPEHRWLRPTVPTLHAYHPLASLAALKALWEVILRPVYWDKTAHGRFDAGAPAPIFFAGAHRPGATPHRPARA